MVPETFQIRERSYLASKGTIIFKFPIDDKKFRHSSYIAAIFNDLVSLG